MILANRIKDLIYID